MTGPMKRILLLSVAVFLAARLLAADTRPNILFFFADDWGRYASVLAKYEDRPSPNQVVKTPNIDRVASEGTIFRNAYVNAPSCTPCRSSLLSGRYFFNTGRGAILQGARWDLSIPTYPLMLKDAGYHIGKMYKVWSPGVVADSPYGGQEHAYEKAGNEFNHFSVHVTKRIKDGQPAAEAKEAVYAQVRNNFDDFLAARPPGKPFCFWFGPTLTHRMWEKGSGKALWGIEPDSLKGKLPKFLPDVPEVREDVADYLGEVQAWDTAIGMMLKKLQDIGEMEKTLIVISGDHGIPGFTRGKCNLYDFGVGVTLITRWPGQKPGRTVDDFTMLMDLAPTFLEAGGVKPPSGMNGRSLLDVIKSDKSGQVDPARTWAITGRERHVAAARPGNLPYPHRALRVGDYLYIRNFAPDRWPMGAPLAVTDTSAPSQEELEKNTFVAFPDMDSSPTKAWLVLHRNEDFNRIFYDYAFAKRSGEELYDLKKDPDNLTNVATDPAYADIKRKLAEQMASTLFAAGDPRFTENGARFENAPFTDPEPENPAGKGPKKGKKKGAK